MIHSSTLLLVIAAPLCPTHIYELLAEQSQRTLSPEMFHIVIGISTHTRCRNVSTIVLKQQQNPPYTSINCYQCMQ